VVGAARKWKFDDPGPRKGAEALRGGP